MKRSTVAKVFVGTALMLSLVPSLVSAEAQADSVVELTQQEQVVSFVEPINSDAAPVARELTPTERVLEQVNIDLQEFSVHSLSLTDSLRSVGLIK